MNERIVRLIDQMDQSGIPYQAGDSSMTVTDRDLEYFAELIVRECMDIVSKQTTLDTNEDFREGFSHGRKLAWTEIRKHFGVEE